MSIRIGIDTGGTFTDLVAVDSESGQLKLMKVHSTPDDPGRAVVNGIERLANANGFSPSDVSLILHGTTVATNAVLERRGADVAVVTTRGFRDVLLIRRQDRPRLYDLRTRRPDTLLPRRNIIEIDERVSADGCVLTPLSDEAMADVAEQLRARGVESVVVALLNSYVNAEHEIQLGDYLATHVQVDVCLSHDVTCSQGEFERFSTALLNGYVQPAMKGYLNNLERALADRGIHAPLLVMKSSGGVSTAEWIAKRSVETLLSGPAGGVVAGVALAEHHTNNNLITADVGGTSFDVSVIHAGETIYTQQTQLSGQTIQLPMMDIHTIGAGGGSVGWVDPGGALRVGPQSAGANPGPACYGQGGLRPTVTDANLILGRIAAKSSLAGGMELDIDAARRAMATVAEPLGLSIEATAEGMLRVVNSSMTAAIRKLTVERGHDPTEFALVPFGGAGPLHGADLAQDIGIRQVIVPCMPGVFSAFGLLLSELREDVSHSYLGPLDEVFEHLQVIFDDLVAEASTRLPGNAPDHIQRRLRLRYIDQGHDLTVNVAPGLMDKAAIEADFHAQHRQVYGYDFTDPIEMVAAWVSVSNDVQDAKIASVQAGSTPESSGHRGVYFSGRVHETPIYQRATLLPTARLTGPAIIEQPDSTVVLLPNQTLTVDRYGQLIIE